MRKPMVTRSFKITKVSAMIANLTEGKTETREIIVPGHYTSEKKLITKLHDITDNDAVRFVYIISKDETDIMYGMSEEDFIAHADILDKKTRRVIDEMSENITSENGTTAEDDTPENGKPTEDTTPENGKPTETEGAGTENKSKKRGK